MLSDGERPERAKPVVLSNLFRLKPQRIKRRPLTAARTAPATATRNKAIDPRDLILGLVRDLDAGHECRIVITGRELDMQKTDLTLTIARGLAAGVHAVLVIDGDDTLSALSHLALRDGVPARVPLDGIEIPVLGLPGEEDGVVFILPLRSVTGDLAAVDVPLLDVQPRAIIVEAPHEGADLTRFAALGDVLYLVDSDGHLRMLDLDATSREVASRKRA
jgi:hypothetical protein